MKIGFVSLGCPKNQVDTEVMLRELIAAGYEVTPDETEAEIVIVNTCAFIESAKKESIDNILDIAWLKENARLQGIVVTGCMAQRYREAILEQLPEVDAVLGTGSLHDIVRAVESVARGEKFTSFLENEAMPLGGERVLTTPSYYAYLKIAEGCDNRCTYCAIPDIRGAFRSRPMEDLVAEAKELESLGVRELILVAQDTTRYGQDLYGEYRLSALIDAICEATEIPWIRLLYCYPDKITDGLLAQFESNPRLCKYVDMPIQHASDRILRRMNRRGDSALIRSVMEKLRAIDGMTVRSTVICGFPGETEEDFTELCEFLEWARFDRLGAFPYSREEGTPAYDFADQVDEQEKQDRADAVMAIAADHAFAQNEAMIGQTVTVLCEEYDGASGVYFGRTAAQAPEIDNKTYFVAKKGAVQPGEFVEVLLTDAMDYDLLGKFQKKLEVR